MFTKILLSLLTPTVISSIPFANAAEQIKTNPLAIQEQGSFAVGGKVLTAPGTFDLKNPTNPAGQTYHGDHSYVFYQKPVNARQFPLVMLYGAGVLQNMGNHCRWA